MPQPLLLPWVCSLRLLRVICGCLVSVGIVLSTVSAHFSKTDDDCRPPITLPPGSESSYPVHTQSAKRRRSGGIVGETIAGSYARYSSSQQSESSLTDQQRICRDHAERDGFKLAPEFEFSDSAVSGTKRHRTGLDQLFDAAKSRRFHVLYFHSLSRLARESVISMPLLKELVYVHKIRVISVSEGVDSDRDGWDMLATMFSIQHERYVKELSANVHRGQAGAVLARFSVGDYRFGYTSVPSPGGEVVGRGREQKPRMVYAVDSEQAEWVRKVFHWFLHDRCAISWIVNELTRLQVPKDHRSTTTDWTRAAVIGILRSPKYIGIWPWGKMKNIRNPLDGQITQEERTEEDIIQYTREFPELRIVDDETFAAVQKLLDRNKEDCARFRQLNGQLNGSPKGQQRKHLLSTVLQCRCGKKLYVGGSNARYLFCAGTLSGTCQCKTQLPRALAEQMILTTIGERILANPEWCSAVYDSVLKAWQLATATQPDEVAGVEKQLHDCNRRISRLVDEIEASDHPDPDVRQRLAERRAERAELERRLRSLGSRSAMPPTAPTQEWVTQQLEKLGEVLNGSTPAGGEALRNLLDGPIVLDQIPIENRKRCYWRGTFVIRLGALASAVSPTSGPIDCDRAMELTETITLDFREVAKPHPKTDEAWELYEQCNLPNVEIAKLLNVSESKLTVILQEAARSRGLAPIDGRSRRSQLAHKNAGQMEYLHRVDEIKQYWDEGLSNTSIADKLQVCRDTVTKAIREWHASRGLSVPDGRERRWNLPKS